MKLEEVKGQTIQLLNLGLYNSHGLKGRGEGGVIGALEPRNFCGGAWTQMMILAKWNPKVQPWSPRAPIFLSWSPGALEPWSPGAREPWSPGALLFLSWSPGALNPFGTLNSVKNFGWVMTKGAYARR